MERESPEFNGSQRINFERVIFYQAHTLASSHEDRFAHLNSESTLREDPKFKDSFNFAKYPYCDINDSDRYVSNFLLQQSLIPSDLSGL